MEIERGSKKLKNQASKHPKKLISRIAAADSIWLKKNTL